VTGRALVRTIGQVHVQQDEEQVVGDGQNSKATQVSFLSLLCCFLITKNALLFFTHQGSEDVPSATHRLRLTVHLLAVLLTAQLLITPT